MERESHCVSIFMFKMIAKVLRNRRDILLNIEKYLSN